MALDGSSTIQNEFSHWNLRGKISISRRNYTQDDINEVTSISYYYRKRMSDFSFSELHLQVQSFLFYSISPIHVVLHLPVLVLVCEPCTHVLGSRTPTWVGNVRHTKMKRNREEDGRAQEGEARVNHRGATSQLAFHLCIVFI